MIEITDGNYGSKILASNNAIMLLFTADWCAPCKVLKPYMKKVGKKFPDVTMMICDAEASPECAAHFEISGLPTILTFVNNQNVDYLTKAPNLGELMKIADQL